MGHTLAAIWVPLKSAAQDKRQLKVRKEIKMVVAKTEDEETKTAAQEMNDWMTGETYF